MVVIYDENVFIIEPLKLRVLSLTESLDGNLIYKCDFSLISLHHLLGPRHILDIFILMIIILAGQT